MTLTQSVEHASTNKLTLTNISEKVSIDGVVMDDQVILLEYMDFIMNNLVDYTVGPEAAHRPEVIAQRIYGTADLWYLILWANDAPSKVEFTPGNTIKAYDPQKMEVLNSILEGAKKRIALSREEPLVIPDITIDPLK
jgi:hypothetical protein